MQPAVKLRVAPAPSTSSVADPQAMAASRTESDSVPSSSSPPPCCYVCYDPDATNANNPLLRSPCNACNLHIHRTCLDRHLIHAAIKERCVLMRVDAGGVRSAGEHGEDVRHVVYASCTVCKRRFEYTSRILVETLKGMNAYVRSLAARVLAEEQAQAAALTADDAAEGGSESEANTDISPIVRDILASVHGMAPRDRPPAQPLRRQGHAETDGMAHVHHLFRFLYEVFQHMSPEEFAKQLTTSMRYLHYASVVGVGCAAVLLGVTARTVWV